ncbi:hypothetical protein [Pseudomonas sp. RIT-To-2]|uniref:hypothetical protein n=1 Tax=Pseudomonas sp. RIT-To-2 TaxID=3462541 RepID=UPI002413137A
MARKTIEYRVEDEGRDFGKLFELREMPCTQAEKWALRVFLAVASNGIELPDDVANAGFAAIAAMGLGLIGKLPYKDAEPLLDEMFTCVRIKPDPGNRGVVRDLVEDDIEEVKTRVKIRMAVFKLHADFSKAAAPSTLAQA